MQIPPGWLPGQVRWGLPAPSLRVAVLPRHRSERRARPLEARGQGAAGSAGRVGFAERTERSEARLTWAGVPGAP